jgi:hypothetical protein
VATNCRREASDLSDQRGGMVWGPGKQQKQMGALKVAVFTGLTTLQKIPTQEIEGCFSQRVDDTLL